MTTLFDVLASVTRILEETRSSTATGGTNSTLIDTSMVEPNDYFNGGIMFFESGANDGISRKITDFNNTTFTFTFSAVSTAIAAGVNYTVSQGLYSRQELVNAVNMALAHIGPYLHIDDTTETVADTEEYDLPAGVHHVKRVQESTNADEPYEWKDPINGWKEVNGVLILKEASETDDLLLRIYYEVPHTEVNLDADTIADIINPSRLIHTAAYFALKVRSEYGGEQDVEVNKQVEQQLMQMLAGLYPIPHMPKDPTLASF